MTAPGVTFSLQKTAGQTVPLYFNGNGTDVATRNGTGGSANVPSGTNVITMHLGDDPTVIGSTDVVIEDKTVSEVVVAPAPH